MHLLANRDLQTASLAQSFHLILLSSCSSLPHPPQQLRALENYARLSDLRPAVVLQLIMRLRTNAGEVALDHGTGGRPQKAGCALSSHLSFLNHSCSPNAAAEVRDGMLHVMALRPVARGEELTISYVDVRLPFQERRRILRDHYQFECRCPRCSVGA